MSLSSLNEGWPVTEAGWLFHFQIFWDLCGEFSCEVIE